MTLRRVSLLVAIAAVYVLAGKLGLQYFAVVHANASAVWPPTGIGLAALLLFGPRVSPAIFVGAFIVNVSTAGSVLASLGVAAGNTLEGLVGARLATRGATGVRMFERAADAFRFLLLVALPSAAVSATIGVTTLSLTGHASWSAFGTIWTTWWMGDVAGAIVVVPVVLLWNRQRGLGPLGERPLEAVVLLLTLVVAARIAFSIPFPTVTLEFITIPVLLWTAFRFGPREVATAVLLLSAFALSGTVSAIAAPAADMPNASLLLLQAFTVTIGVTMLPVATLVWESKRAGAERLALLAREQAARAEAEERRRFAEELAAIARSYTETHSVADVGTRVVEVVLGLFGVHASSLRLLAADGSLIGIAFGGAMKTVFGVGHVLAGGNASVSGLAVAQGAAAWTDDAFADPRLRVANDVRRGMTSVGDAAVLAVPLRVKGQIIGVLSVGDHAGRRFTATEADALQTFADQAAVVVENARLYEEAMRRRRESDVVAALAAEINRSLDIDHVLQQVAEAARALCGGDVVHIVLREAGTDALRLRLAVGSRLAADAEVVLTPSGGLGGEVVASGRPYRTPDVRQDPNLLPDRLPIVEQEGVRSSLIVPVLGDEKIEGLIYVSRRSVRPFSDHEETVGQRLADHAAIAIRNSRLFAAERAARADAHAANRAKDHFLATLSHELRTPLNAMMGWLRMLRNPRLEEEQKTHAVDVIERNARLQAQLINDLLDVSRIIAGKLELEKYPVDLVLVVREAIEAIRGDVEARPLTLRVDLDPATGEVLGDPLRLQQIVANLLSNAVKFTPAGGIVEVRLGRESLYARLTIRDSGEGIEAAALPHVFEPFHQADSATTRGHQGLGLGLAIVRQLVEAHSGRVRAQSAGRGQGATFTVDLPIVAVRERRARPEAAPAVAGARLDGLRVLVVDDHGDARELLGLVLRERGAEVHLASGTAEALSVLARTTIDVLVSDLAMPGADGFDLIAAVRGTPAARGAIPAVALTAYAGREIRDRALAAGFTAHAVKPLDPEALVELLARLPR
jgi:signal transduction histidine kinase/integral membrane sensor domain MASE1